MPWEWSCRIWANRSLPSTNKSSSSRKI